MAQYGVNGSLRIGIKRLGLCRSITLGHYGHINFVGSRAALVQIAVGRHGGAVKVAYENVVRRHLVCQAACHLVLEVEQAHGHLGRVGWHWQQKVFSNERLVCVASSVVSHS